MKKITVLMADDNAVVRKSLCSLLEMEGYSEVVGQARNGREAVKMAHTLRPDGILMDLAMPVLNGFEATLQILAANPTAKVLILSAHSLRKTTHTKRHQSRLNWCPIFRGKPTVTMRMSSMGSQSKVASN